MSKQRWVTAEEAYERKLRNKKIFIASYLLFTVILISSLTILLGSL
ncbi:hypothetical protein [Peribacillus asahii]|uniref:Uncharacterized protein n=1 Tax=Peribacillus asahii TaxID=228899 RepID=A0A3T0KW32_9BACI|nr:hypothetical protein [Peribacillus asahii]AZV44517.1 hypothetical protein BAOM_3908 [Peribacillus asahii]USK58908.1 hypothetical protein LIT37_17065 [Peribacillus asahii]USK69319.1 hypothetical protein LIS76_17420 [Peribacillus asahii]USK84196.1 hypothetical protein LIT35_17440 [Peribacillus asahii]